MRPANKIQNKIHLTRSRSVHPLFPLLSNWFGATLHRGNVVLRSPRRTPKSCNVGAVTRGSRWQAVLAGSSWWLAAAGYASGSLRGPPWLPGF